MPSSGSCITWKILNILVAPWGFTIPTSPPKMLQQLTRIVHDEHTSVSLAKRYKRDVVPAFWNICSQRKIIRQPADFRRLPPSNGKTAHVDVMMTRKIELNL